jgi:A/G-specific adenine glycosylase
VADVDLAFFPGQWYSEDALQMVALPTVQKKLMARIKTN